ncbi:MAG: hypothetical protein H9533_21780 [Rhodobacteraceae bacterium]|nr:hypothetical protein [Paracoccaceae bacterium]
MQPDDLIAILGIASGYRKGAVRIDSGTASSNAEIEDLVAEMYGQSASGWIARQSGIEDRPGPLRADLGSILEAELGTAAETLQLRRIGDGWGWTRLVETGDGGMLVDEVELAAVGGRSALYRRYWALPDTGAAEVTTCRLISVRTLGEET